MNEQDRIKMDRCIAGRIWESRLQPHVEALKVGDTIEIDVRFGDEGGPDWWSRCEATIEERHVLQADQYEADYKSGKYHT